jgi:hypothetical protein
MKQLVYYVGEDGDWQYTETGDYDSESLARLLSNSPKYYLAVTTSVSVPQNLFSFENIFCNGYMWEGTQFINYTELMTAATSLSHVDAEGFLKAIYNITMRERA